jgi:sulfite reductase alpha subunit-like flavoprotein
MKIPLSLFLLAPAASAFVVTLKQTTGAPLFLSPDDRIKKSGAGIALVSAGDNSLFDPGQEGKLGGTNDLQLRLSRGAEYLAAVPLTQVTTMDAQHWLEDIGVPANFAKPTAPVEATVLGRMSLIDADAPGDIQHVLLKLPPGFHYVEGQSLSVIPPGLTEAGKPQKPRLYSIASTRYGDLLDGNTVSLCVRRAEYCDPVTGLVDPTKKGICSNFLCDVTPGTKVQVAGPVGKTMLIPEDPDTDIIMVATGTGIAPFRSFLQRLFMENTVARHLYTGKAWLILGVPTTGGLLYHEELEAMKKNAG